MRVDQFDFNLPETCIALRPAHPRTSARLLVVRGAEGRLEDHRIGDLPELLRSGDILVRNTTRVIKGALEAQRARLGGEGVSPRIHLNLNRRLGDSGWSAFARPGKKLQIGDTLIFGGDLTARVTGKFDAGAIELTFNQSGAELDRLIDQVGATPIPPYIAAKRPVDERDEQDYQTCFAETGESVAAPTAGLHLTPDLIADLSRRGVLHAKVRLDVNAGTFLPMKVDDISQHHMHAEQAFLEADAAQQISSARDGGGRCVAVGTTALRTLESAADERGLHPFHGDTSIFITPGYRFRATDALLTNFHLPRSTLFVLVCALMGIDVMQRAYAHAIREEYRFYSYGDACLLLPNG